MGAVCVARDVPPPFGLLQVVETLGLGPLHRRLARRPVLMMPIQLIGPTSPFGNSRETFRKSGTDGSNPVPSSRESVSLRISPTFLEKARIFRQLGDHAGWQRRQRRAKPRNNEPRSGSVSVERYSSTAVLLAAVRDIGGAGRKRDRLPRGKRCRWSFELGSAQATPSTVRCSCQASGRCECASSLSAVRPRGSRRRGWLA